MNRISALTGHTPEAGNRSTFWLQVRTLIIVAVTQSPTAARVFCIKIQSERHRILPQELLSLAAVLSFKM